MFWVALRWISAVEAFALIGWAVAVLQEAKAFRPPNVYVRLVTASYILLVVAAALHAIAHTKGEPHSFVVLRTFALTFGLGAMFYMWRHYRYAERVKRHGLRSDDQAARIRRESGVDDD